jgi:hypothetical protein
MRQHLLASRAPLADRGDLLGQVLDPRATCFDLAGIALVQTLEAIVEFGVGKSDNSVSDVRVKLRSLLLTALIRVPSTAINARPNRSNWRQSSTNWRKTGRKALALSRRKSAMVLKSGFRCRSNQITSMLRWVSASSRRLDRTRFR